jgi:hypothetical protein
MSPTRYNETMRAVRAFKHWHWLRRVLVGALVLIAAGVVVDSLLSASWALDDGLLIAAAVIIGLALFLLRGHDARHP